MRLVLLSALLAAAAFMPARADLVETIARVKPAVVAVGTFQPTRSPQHVFQGTGFVVAQGLSVVTNAHVVPKTLDAARQERLIVLAEVAGRAQVRGARIARVDLAHDLMLLAIEGPPLPALTLGDAARVREGMEVAFTGFPLGMALGLRPVTHRGIVSAITPVATRMGNARDLSPQAIERLKNPFFVFQLDATAYPGNSGSPLYDPHTGEVLGVLNSAFVKQSKEAAIRDPSGISYVIPVTFVRELLEAGP
ncbi:MAG: serine protease [Burkholderiales bacterium]